MANNTYKSPGVFVNEIDKSWYETPKTRSISVTLLGPAQKGDFNIPTDVESYTEFKQLFGEAIYNAGYCASLCLAQASTLKFVRIGDGTEAPRKANIPVELTATADVANAMTFSRTENGAVEVVVSAVSGEPDQFNLRVTVGEDIYDSSTSETVAGPFTLSDFEDGDDSKKEAVATACGCTITYTADTATHLTPGTYTGGATDATATVNVPGKKDTVTTVADGIIVSYKVSGTIESEEWVVSVKNSDGTNFGLSIDRKLSSSRFENLYNSETAEFTLANIASDLSAKSDFTATVSTNVTSSEDAKAVNNTTEPITFLDGNNGWSQTSGYDVPVTDTNTNTTTFEVNPGILAGLESISDREVITTDIVAAPDLYGTLYHDELAKIAGTRKDIVVLLDLPQISPGPDGNINTAADKLTVDENEAVRLINAVQTEIDLDGDGVKEDIGSYLAAYYPWVTVTGKVDSVPPSVAMLPAMMREYIGYPRWTAPAGQPRLDLVELTGYDKVLTQKGRDTVYEGRINPLCNYKNLGNTAMGQKTLLKEDSQGRSSSLNRLNVRLLMNYIKLNVELISASYIFSTIDQQTMDSWVLEVGKFLDSIRNQRGIYDYRVNMSWNTVTPENLNNNIMPGVIQVKPSRVAEYIPIDIVILNRDDEFMS